MPTNYTLKRRIGSPFLTNGSAQFKAFKQDGDRFIWDTPVGDVAATNPGTSAVTRTLTLPVGIRVNALLTVTGDGLSLGTDNPIGIYISDLSITDNAPSLSVRTSASYFSGSGELATGGPTECMTNTSAQVRSRIQVSTANTILYITTRGWIDARGRT
jgi:hypothetical protein